MQKYSLINWIVRYLKLKIIRLILVWLAPRGRMFGPTGINLMILFNVRGKLSVIRYETWFLSMALNRF